MASNDIQYNQSNFNRGEIDGLLGARFDYEDYDKSLKRARNCITLPQGAITKRFGSKLINTYSQVSDATQIEISTILYNDDTTFLVVWYPGLFDVYIENTKFQTSTASGSPVYAAADIIDLRFSQNGNNLVITNPNFTPRGLKLTPTTFTVTSSSGTTVTLSGSSLATGQIFPFIFSTGVYVSSPSVYINRTYFAVALSATTFEVFNSAQDAAANVNPITFTSAATTPTATTYNSWAIADLPINTFPTFDFTSGAYLAQSYSFTPSATSGTQASPMTVTGSSAVFTANALIGGIYSGNGGILRITGNTTTILTGYTIVPFPSTDVIPGPLSFVSGPAWSATAGYPRVSTTFQGRLFYAGSPGIPNGIWGSVVNEPSNFDDSEAFPDSAISYYPASGNITYIQSITAARSLVVHTNTGSFSTALSTEQPLTPANVSFVEQNKDGASAIQPVFIDNQIIYIDKSYNNVKNLIWELSQSSYILRNISIVSSSLIRKPVDSANYSNPLFIDGSYVLIVNGDGTLATFNTLYMENVAGWTLQETVQWASSDGSQTIPSSYVHVVSSFERVWFLVNRTFYTQVNSVTISGSGPAPNSIILGTFLNASTSVFQFTFVYSTGTQSVFSQTLEAGVVYYAIQYPPNLDVVTLYPSYTDAVNGTNPIIMLSPGDSGNQFSFYQPYQLFCLEELDFSQASLDCWAAGNISSGTFTFDSIPQTSPGTLFNGQWVYYYINQGDMVLDSGDVVRLGNWSPPTQILNNTFTADLPNSGTAYIGFPFTTEITFLPINIPLVTGNNFYRPKQLRQFYLYYYQSLDAEINGVSFPVIPLYEYELGSPALPHTNIVSLPPMVGWEPLDQDITITQSSPAPLTILGYSAAVEIS